MFKIFVRNHFLGSSRPLNEIPQVGCLSRSRVNKSVSQDGLLLIPEYQENYPEYQENLECPENYMEYPENSEKHRKDVGHSAYIQITFCSMSGSLPKFGR